MKEVLEECGCKKYSYTAATWKRGGGYSGLDLMDKWGTKAGDSEGRLAERNPVPIWDVAVKFSNLGVDNT
jgi:hypothetical protein